MPRRLRLLVVAEQSSHLELIERELRGGGFEPSAQRVSASSKLEHALSHDHWEIVVADSDLHALSPRKVLELVGVKDPDLPVIFLGEADPEAGSEIVGAGARDYISLDQIARLAPAVGRELADAEIHRELRRLNSGLARISADIHSSLDIGVIIQRVLGFAAEALDADSALVLTRAQDRWRIGYVHGLPASLVDGTMPAEGDPRTSAFARAREPLVIDDASADDWLRDHLASFGVRSLLAIPLVSGGETVGIILLNYDHRATFSPEQLEFAGRLADDVSLALENARLYGVMQQELTRLAALKAIGMEAAGALGLEEMCTKVVEAVKELLGATLATVYVVEEGQEALRQVASTRRDIQGSVGPLRFGEDAVLTALVGGDLDFATVQTPGISRMFKRRMKALGVEKQRPLITPIGAKGHVLGLLMVTLPGKGAVSDAEVSLYHSVADWLGLALESARLYGAQIEAERRAKAELETTNLLLEAADSLAMYLDLPRLLDSLAGIMLRVLEGGRVSIVFVDEQQSELRVAASRGIHAVPPGTTFKLSETHPGVLGALDEGKIAVVDFDRPGVLPEVQRGARSADVRLLLVVPLKVGDKAVGFAGVDQPGRRHEFAAREISLGEGIAAQAAVAIENSRLYERQKRRAELNRVINEIVTSLTIMIEPADQLPIILPRAVRALGAMGAAVTVRDEGRWTVEAAAGLRDLKAGAQYSDEEVPTLMHLLSGEPLLVSDASLSAQSSQAAAEKFGYGSYIAFPLRLRGRVFGGLTFSWPRPRPAFPDEDVDFVARLAQGLSFAYENARLYGEEHRIAQTLQRSMLWVPGEVEGIEVGHVYASATESALVGGDFYDIFQVSAGQLALVVGDVSGKGLEAASMTALVKNALRAHAIEGLDPGVVLAKLNHLVWRFSPTETFVTVFLGILDSTTCALDYAMAGHPPPLVRRRSGEVEPLEVADPLLGAFEGVKYRTRYQKLQRGETILMYTDGVIEARYEGIQYGEERLMDFLRTRRSLRVTRLAEEIFRDVWAFAHGDLRDDVAILAVRLSQKASNHTSKSNPS